MVPNETEQLTITDQYNEFVMTGLRTMWGVDKGLLLEKFGAKYLAHFEAILSSKEIDDQHFKVDERKVVLTEGGKHFADRIASGLFY